MSPNLLQKISIFHKYIYSVLLFKMLDTSDVPTEHEVFFGNTSLLHFLKQKDNNVITMASHYGTIKPLSKVKLCWADAKEKMHAIKTVLHIKCFNTIFLFLANLSISTGTVYIKRQWWAVVTHVIDVFLVRIVGCQYQFIIKNWMW